MFTVKCVVLYILNKISHNFDCVVGLQKCMRTLRIDRGPCTGTGQMSSDDANQFVGIKAEDVTDIKVEEDPWPATSTGMKTEPAVSCLFLCVCVKVYVHWTNNIQTSCRIRCEWKIYCFSGHFAF